MSISYNSSIVTTGLILCLDAGNPRSYPGSGTVYRDVSGTGNNGTLINGVGYSSANLGTLVFDGIDDYVNTGNVGLPTTALTVSTWVYDTDVNGSYRYIAAKIGSFLFRIDSNAEGANLSAFVWIGGTPEPRISTSWTKNVWTNMAFTWNTDGNFRLFKNGVVATSSTSRTGTLNTSALNLTIGGDDGGGLPWKGNISNTMVYNATLTAAQIEQNFNAARGRYGI